MELNQSTLRGILARILSVDESFVVPKQGNWYNPQNVKRGQPDTWCAYRIKSNKARTTPFYFLDKDNVQTVCIEKIATIELQFVGSQSEELANSVANWTLRSDVQSAFADVQGAVMYSGSDAISSVFSQQGNNTVMAWNVDFQVLWYSQINANQSPVRTIDLGGQVNVR